MSTLAPPQLATTLLPGLTECAPPPPPPPTQTQETINLSSLKPNDDDDDDESPLVLPLSFSQKEKYLFGEHICAHEFQKAEDVFKQWVLFKRQQQQYILKYDDDETFLTRGLEYALRHHLRPMIKFLTSNYADVPVRAKTVVLAVTMRHVGYAAKILEKYLSENKNTSINDFFMVQEEFTNIPNQRAIRDVSVTLLTIAANNNDIPMAKYLIDHGAWIHYAGDAALHRAFHKQKTEMITFLLSMCATTHQRQTIVSSTDKTPYSYCQGCWEKDDLHALSFDPLSHAVTHYKHKLNTEVARAVLEAKLVNVRANDNAILKKALVYNPPRMVCLLVQYGADLTIVPDSFKNEKCFREYFTNYEVNALGQCVAVLETCIDKDVQQIHCENAFAFVVLRDIVLRTTRLLS